MAVYEHTYKPYTGPVMPAWSRFLVIPRYAYQAVFQSKLFAGFFALCFVCPLIMAILIYLHHNMNALALMGIQPRELVQINGFFFNIFTIVQTNLGFLLTVVIGPVLISRDLSNNALPLYLCRPLSRGGYVLGKAAVLAFLLSLITWIPGLLLFVFQAYLEGGSWWRENLWLANAILLGSWAWIAMLTLPAMALSAWIKWRMAASGALFALFTIPVPVSLAIGAMFKSSKSMVLSLSMILKNITDGMFLEEPDLETWMIISSATAWTALLVWSLVFLYMLWRKVRAYEVVS